MLWCFALIKSDAKNSQEADSETLKETAVIPKEEGVCTTKLNPNTTISASIASVVQEELTGSKKEIQQAKDQAQSSHAEKVSGMLTDLIKAQLQSPSASTAVSTSNVIMPPPPVPPTTTTTTTATTTATSAGVDVSPSDAAAKKDAQVYTLGKWVDTIIVKMNIPSIDDLEVDESIRQSNFGQKSELSFFLFFICFVLSLFFCYFYFSTSILG